MDKSPCVGCSRKIRTEVYCSECGFPNTVIHPKDRAVSIQLQKRERNCINCGKVLRV